MGSASQNSYIVSFDANGFSSHEMVMRYVLRRAAEVTIENGHSHFSIIQSQNTTKYNISSIGGSVSSVTLPAICIRIECYSKAPYFMNSIDAQEYLDLNPVPPPPRKRRHKGKDENENPSLIINDGKRARLNRTNKSQ
ncbi:MAG: hypothetical protein VX777_06355 [Chlamydiota bacterium]|nr:hypothetical protein [Chlamydiota bacterium]